MRVAHRHSRLRRVARVLAVVSVVVSLLPLAAESSWVLDLFSHFRVQYLVAQCVLAVGLLLLRDHRWILVPALGTVLNVAPLTPYLRGGEAVVSANTFSIVAVNVFQDNESSAGLLETIAAEDPDVVLVVELTDPWLERLAGLADSYPYRLTEPREGAFGIGLFSRLPLVESDLKPIGATPGIDALLAIGNQHVRLIGVHLLPPTSRARARGRNEQLAELARLTRENRMPLAICGDFNISPYSPHFRKLLDTTGLRDSRSGRGLTFSWPSYNPLLRIPIDHCLVSGDLAVLDNRRLPGFGSDHYPLLVELAKGRPDE